MQSDGYAKGVKAIDPNKQQRTTNNSYRASIPGPPVPCKYRKANGEIVLVDVLILMVYADGFACVYSEAEDVTISSEGYWIVRNGIDWPQFYKTLLRHFKAGLKVPYCFKPIKRIPEEALLYADALSPEAAEKVVLNLMAKGYLRPLKKMTPENCPKEMNWTSLRSHYQEF